MTKTVQGDLSETLALVSRVKADKAKKKPWTGFTVFKPGNQYWKLRRTCSKPGCKLAAVRGVDRCAMHGGGSTLVAREPVRTVPHKVKALIRSGQTPAGFADDPDVKLVMSLRAKHAGPLLADLLEGAVALDTSGDARQWLEAKRNARAKYAEIQSTRKANPARAKGWCSD